MSRLNFKYCIRQIHLWLGLASGLVVFIVSITGCIFVFQKEITDVLHPGWAYTGPTPDTSPLSLTRLQKTAQDTLGRDHPLSYIVTWREPGRPWEFMSYHENDTALTAFGGMEYYLSVFIDPYTGKVTGIRDYKHDFFNIVKYIHWSLLLNTRYGQPIVAWSTVIFVVLLITGLVLWWPKKWTKAVKERSFKIKWKASFRRVNYDLHNVPGFYSLIPALIIAITGLVFVWPPSTPALPATRSVPATQSGPVTQSVPTTRSVPTTQSVSTTRSGPATQSVPTAVTQSPMDQALHTSMNALPASVRFGISPAVGKEGVIYVTAYGDAETFYGYDVLQFDQYSGKLLDHLQNAKKTKFQRLVEMNYDLHVGSIGGLTGKIIAFMASLICASLPITGFLVWYLKRQRRFGRRPVIR